MEKDFGLHQLTLANYWSLNTTILLTRTLSSQHGRSTNVELEQYEVVGNLNFSTPAGSRSASPYQRSSLTFQEPNQQVETISLRMLML